MKHRTSEMAIAAATVVSFVLFLVVPGPQVPWWAMILAGLMATLSLGVLISVRRQLRGIQRKLSSQDGEQALERLRAAQNGAWERLERRFGEVEGVLARVHAQQLHAERSRAKADNKTHDALGTVQRELRPGFADELSGNLGRATEHLHAIEGRMARVESGTQEHLEKILLGQAAMERSRARSVTKTHELVRRNEHDLRENLRRLGTVESDLRSLERSMKALRELLVEASVTLDVMMCSAAPEDVPEGSGRSGHDLSGRASGR